MEPKLRKSRGRLRVRGMQSGAPLASTQAGSELALEVAASCAIGDHNHLGRLAVRAGFGFLQLAIGSLVNLRGPLGEATVKGDIAFVVANPVAHGSRLARAVLENARSSRITTIADVRYADPLMPVDVAFPGISARSLRSIVTFRRLKFALSLRRALTPSSVLAVSSSRLYNEYLYIAQAIRYLAIQGVVCSIPISTLVLTDFDRSAYSRPWIWAANARGLQTATLMHGSPNEANYVPVLASHALVWGEVQRSWVEKKSPTTHAITIGRPELRSSRVLWSKPQRVVVCHSQETLSPTEIRDLVAQIRVFRERGLPITLRLHPTATEATLDSWWATIARIADDVVVGFTSFPESVRSSDVVVCITSSSAVEAVIRGIPTIIIADHSRALPADLEAIQSNTPAMLGALHSQERSSVELTLETLAARLVAAFSEDAGSRLDSALTAIRTTPLLQFPNAPSNT